MCQGAFGGKTRHPSSHAAARLNDGVSPSLKIPRPHQTNKAEGRHILGRDINKDMQRLRAERMVGVVGIHKGGRREERCLLFRAAPNYSLILDLLDVFRSQPLSFFAETESEAIWDTSTPKLAQDDTATRTRGDYPATIFAQAFFFWWASLIPCFWSMFTSLALGPYRLRCNGARKSKPASTQPTSTPLSHSNPSSLVEETTCLCFPCFSVASRLVSRSSKEGESVSNSTVTQPPARRCESS